MNIVAPIPTTVVFNTANVNTESARRDNMLRETVPQTSGVENSSAESGLGSESDRVKQPGQAPQPVTYERPQVQHEAAGKLHDGATDKDNAEDPSAGKDDAQSRQQEQQKQAEAREIQEYKERDREVRAHEQAHASVGGQYAGAPTYDYENGPDGRQYAVGGEVSIDISEEQSPEDTLRKMQQVKAAALAPVEPSAQDLRVANEATQKAAEARAEIAKQKSQHAATINTIESSKNGGDESNLSGPQTDWDELVNNRDISPPRRALAENDPVAEIAGLAMEKDEFSSSHADSAALASPSETMVKRTSVIENFYQNSTSSKTGLHQYQA